MSMRRDPAWRRYARFLRPDPAADVEEELAFHLEQRVRDYIARGMPPEGARAAALERFGDVSGVRRECTELLEDDRRAAARRDWLGDLAQDLRFAARASARSPLFTLLAVLTLALGIGANAAVFGVVKSVLLDALPYGDADRVVRIYGRLLDGTQERGPLSAGTVSDIAARQRSFSQMAAFSGHVPDAVYGGDDGPRLTKLAWVEPAFFRTLGVPAALGRTFADDDIPSDTARVVVLSHGAWQRIFGGDSTVLGRDIRINGIPRSVIGVLPRGFVPPLDEEADFYFALDLRPTLRSPISARRSHWLGAVARLRSGVTHEAARRQLAAIGADLAREHPADNGSLGVTAMPIREALVGDTRTPLLVLLASAGLVLLITCANLAGALLSRTISRRKEFAVRVALGAGRGRIVRQLLTESTLLALAGAAVGLLLAMLALAALRGLALPALPDYAELSLDTGALLVTAAVALLTGIAFGLAPAVSVGRADAQATLRDESRGASESRRSRQLRGVLVAGQIALCVSLLAGAGLLARSLREMTAAPLGFDPDGVLTVPVQLPQSSYRTDEAVNQFKERFAERLRALPGVERVAYATSVPTAIMSRAGLTIVGAPPPPNDAQPFVLIAPVSDDYFQLLRIPLRMGRTFDARDHAKAPQAVVVSESMARRYWPAGGAMGARIRLGPDPNSTPLEVVGIVGDVRNDPALREAEPQAYTSMRQWFWPAMFVVRAQGDPARLVPSIRRELAAIDRALPLDETRTLQGIVDDGLSGRRLPVLLMGAFGVLALVLASVGVYAMFAAMAAAREREFGVRLALGASRGAIAGLVLRQGALWMGIGLVSGAAGVVVVSRLVRGLLYGVSPFDPLSLVGAAAVLVLCAALAVLVPVRRATRADPIAVLR